MKYIFLTYCVFISWSMWSQGRIIGGNNADIKDYPWTANMRIVNTYGVRLLNRSAIILSENLILTAAHNWPTFDYNYLLVHVGGSCLDIGKYHKVHRYIKHPTLDLILLELSTPLNFTERVQPIDYKSSVDESLYAADVKALISGWGTTVPNNPSETPLCFQAANVSIITNAEANRAVGYTVATEKDIATREKETIKMAGKGDSGGPIVVWDNNAGKHVLAGVTKQADVRTIENNSGLTIYTKVKPAIEWIDKNKCELTGPDEVLSTGGTFQIVNLPPNVQSIEWVYSGLNKITSDNNTIDVIPTNIDNETTGTISAVIHTNLGSVTLPTKKLNIKARIDINAAITYVNNKYKLRVKTVNMGTLNSEDVIKCKEISEKDQLFGFVWAFNNSMSVGTETIFDIDPNTSKSYTISVTKYDCESTMKLEKTFTIEKKNNEYIPIYNSPGTITIGGEKLSITADFNISGNLKMTYSKNNSDNTLCMDLETSPIQIESPVLQLNEIMTYNVNVYSRTGLLMYKGAFNSNEKVLHINTLTYPPDIYIINIYNPSYQTVKRYNIVVGR